MKLPAIITLLALSGCGAITAHKNNGRAHVGWYLADMAAFTAGACLAMDGALRQSDTSSIQMLTGFPLALGAWLPYWFVETR